MNMIGSLNFTADSAAAVAETFGRINPVPGFMKAMGPYVRSSIEGGIATLSIYEFDESRAEAAIDYLKQRYATFSAIPGVASNIEEWLGIDAVLKLLDESGSVTDALESVSFRI